MATALSHNLLSIHTLRSNPFAPRKHLTLTRPRSFSSRLKTVVKSSSNKKNSATSPTKPHQQLSGSKSGSFFALISRLRDGSAFDELGLEILSIAVPAALALAADPITSLVDTAFIGHIGSVELAAVGVSVSVFNLVSKLINVPLLNVTTSFVAEEQALVCNGDSVSSPNGEAYASKKRKKVSPPISTSLILAAAVGIAEAVALLFGSGYLMNIMGIPADSPMREPAEHFLTWRAFGAPPIVIALAAQGAFRGFKDTKTPLYATVAGNILNAILDPILIFFCGFGVGGAAISTVISEYLIAIVLLWELNGIVQLAYPAIDVRRLVRYLNSGGLLIGRSIAVLLTTTIATSMAAREGPVPMAGHQICMEVWLTLSLLNDALALAGQALLAGGYGQGNYKQARQVIYRVIQIGLITGVALGVILSIGFGAFAGLFSTDREVLKIAYSGVLFVAGSQPMNALAFVLDGLYYGVSDFGYAAYSMVLVGLISSAFIFVTTPMFGLAGVWSGLFLFMTLRVVAGIWRLGTRTGPWETIWANVEQERD